jgi:hypothetical protein
MADGKEEREARKARLEAEKNPPRPADTRNSEPDYEGEPERGGS